MNDALLRRAAPPLALVLLAAAGTFALTMGARQAMGLFLGAINTHTGLGLASISLAFAFGQLWWGLTQPFAGMVADRIGAVAGWAAALQSLAAITLLALPAARRLSRRMAGRQGLRGERQLRLDVVRRHRAGRRGRAAAPADPRERAAAARRGGRGLIHPPRVACTPGTTSSP